MPVEIQWLLENKVISVVAVGDISPNDLSYTSEEIVNHIEQSSAPLVHVIISEEQMTGFPKSLSTVSKVANFLRHERLGWFLIYDSQEKNRIILFVTTAVTSMAKVRHRRFLSMEECLEFLVTVDTTLPAVEDMLSE